MCGIVGIVGRSPVNTQIYDALTLLQHRGQDAAGIMTSARGKFNLRKSNGLVKDVFRTRHMQRLEGNIGIGHVRYPTAGSSSAALAQPFYVNSPYGIGLAHNGNLTNAADLAEDLFREDLRHLNTDSDSEVLLNIFAHELTVINKLRPTPDDVFTAISGVYRRVRGAYAVTGMINGFGMFAFRDPNGIRPLVYGKREQEDGTAEYMVASESVALDVLGFELVRDVRPGEALFITESGKLFSKQCISDTRLTPCIFEHVYFARPDSVMDNVVVYKARRRMGERLAEKIQREWADHDIDVVMPIPDTSRVSGLAMAQALGVNYVEGLVKNRYIGRTFIMPGQALRKKSVRQKLNCVSLEFEGRNVMLVDDSIVRGTTSRQIIEMAREAGAKKVYLASAAPAVTHPNVYGIDMPSADELVAAGKTLAEVEQEIGADKLIYQDLDDLIACVDGINPEIDEFECSVFNGQYVTGDIDHEYLLRLDAARNDASKSKSGAPDDNDEVVGIHNDEEAQGAS